MHFSLRDRYHFRSRFAEISLLTASVVFLVTTFASTNLYQTLGLPPELSRVVLGLASAIAFIFSLALLVIDWRGSAARHQDATKYWSEVIGRFRDTRLESGDWPEEVSDELSAGYAHASQSSVAIPDKKFNSLKIQYLSKIEVSKLAQKYPGAPGFLLWIIVRFKGSYAAIRQGNGE